MFKYLIFLLLSGNAFCQFNPEVFYQNTLPKLLPRDLGVWAKSYSYFVEEKASGFDCVTMDSGTGTSNDLVVFIAKKCLNDFKKAQTQEEILNLDLTRELVEKLIQGWVHYSVVDLKSVWEELIDYHFFNTANTLGVNFDQDPESALVEFWSKTIYRSLTDSKLPYRQPKLVQYLKEKVYFNRYPHFLPDDLQEMAEKEKFTIHGKVKVLADANESWWARVQLVKNAKETLHIQYFIYFFDVFGKSFAGYLLDALKRGVKITMMIDGRGAAGQSRNDILQELMHQAEMLPGSIEIKIYNPFSAGKIAKRLLKGELMKFVASNHDKILMADHRFLITGGRNLAAHYFLEPNESKDFVYLDTDVFVDFGETLPSGVLAAFRREFHDSYCDSVFFEDFNLVSQEKKLELAQKAMDLRMKRKDLSETDFKLLGLQDYQELSQYRSLYGIEKYDLMQNLEDSEVEVLDKTSHLGPSVQLRERVYQEILNSKEIAIQNPYLVLSKKAKEVFAQVLSSGAKLEFHVPTPTSTDSYPTQAVLFYKWREIFQELPGVRIFGYKGPSKLHSKVFVFDESKSIIGSYNLDPQSERFNSEIALFIKNQKIADFLRKRMRAVWSLEYDPEKNIGPESVANFVEGGQKAVDFYKNPLIRIISEILEPIL